MWPAYRAVVDLEVATWTEVNTMSLDDLDLLCMAADAVFDAQNAAQPSGPVSEKHGRHYENEFEYDQDPPPVYRPAEAPFTPPVPPSTARGKGGSK